MSPHCRNCGGHVSQEYVRVLAPDDGKEGVAACPQCPDVVRVDGKIQPAKATRNNQHGRVDP